MNPTRELNLKKYRHLPLPLVAIAAAISVSCRPVKNVGDAEPQPIDLAKLQQGPIRHVNLTDQQMARVTRLHQTFREVDPSPVEKWVEDFKRDQNPDNELSVWEAMATAYSAFTSTRSLTLLAKKEVFQIILQRSSATDEEVLKHLDLHFLSLKDAQEIMSHFPHPPDPIKVTKP